MLTSLAFKLFIVVFIRLIHVKMPTIVTIVGIITLMIRGAQWLSGRVLDSRPKGRGFEPNRRHCVVVLEQDTFILA